jgi:UDP-glucuronate decarboxylase
MVRSNLGNPIEHSMAELATIILDLTNSKSKIVNLPPPKDDPRQRRPDIARAESLLGWKPRVGLEEGLRKTISYFAALASEGLLPRASHFR